MPELVSAIIGLLIAIVVVTILLRSVRVIRQQQVGVVERLGKFRRTLEPGPHLLVPIIDSVRYTMDMREAVVPFPPQGVITEDNLMVGIDSVIYYQVVDPVRAAYEAQNYIQAIEQLTMTTLRNIIGGLDLEQTLTSREEINQKLRAVLDEATGKWGIKVNRVELRAIEPPATIRDAMEKGARAERDKRAAILTAEGQRQSMILSASGDREASILRAQGERESAVLRAQADRQASMLRAEGEAQAITTTFNAIHAGKPDAVAAGLPVPADAAEPRQGRVQQGLDHPERTQRRPEGPRATSPARAQAAADDVEEGEFSAPDQGGRVRRDRGAEGRGRRAGAEVRAAGHRRGRGARGSTRGPAGPRAHQRTDDG